MNDVAVPDLDVELPAAPYPGLRPFKKREWPIFFGRETMIDAVVDRLIERQFVLVHGDSGCGKSSLVRAGMFAQLERQATSATLTWRTSDMFPRNGPLANLATALARLSDRPDDEDTLIACRRALNYGDRVSSAMADILPESRGLHRCLLVDQFEEIFAFARHVDHNEARQFVDVLSALARSPAPGLYIVATMRSEFLGNCAQYRDFAEIVNETQYLLPRMGRTALLRAIQEPARLFGVEIARELADRLIADSGGRQDQLPLIQHGLTRLYQRAAASGGLLTLDDYRRSGDLATMLSAHADQIRDEAITAHGPTKAAERGRILAGVFRALTDTNADGHATSRAQTVTALSEVAGTDIETIRSLLDPFRRDGVSFLTPGIDTPLEPGRLVTISHEALVRCWQWIADRKDGLLQQEFIDGVTWKNLLVRAQSYDKDRADVLSFTGLDERKKWFEGRTAAWSSRYGGGWPLVDALIAGSLKSRRQRRTGAWVAGIGVVLVFAGYAWREVESAKDARETSQRLAVVAEELAASEQRANDRIQRARLDAADEISRLNQLIDARDSRISELEKQARTSPVDLVAREGITEIPARPQIQSPLPVSATESGPTCEGAIWIGSEENSYLRQLASTDPVAPASVKVGDIYRVKANVMLRDGLPSDDYKSRPAIGTVAENSQVKVLAAPRAYDRGKVQQYWLRVAAAPQACIVAYIQFAGSIDKAKAFAAALRGSGYKVPDVDEEKSAKGLAELRFFYESDIERANLLARQSPKLSSGKAIKIVPLYSWKGTKPQPGTIEVWIDFDL